MIIQASTNNIFMPEHGLALFCVTKAANTSIKRCVLDALARTGDPMAFDRREGSTDWINTHRHPALHRMPLQQIAASAQLQDVFKAAFVRNPFDRLVSCYTEKVLGGHKLKGLKATPETSFVEFVHMVCNTPDDESDVHLESQHRFFEWEGRLLTDFIGTVEDIGTHWEAVRRLCPLPLESLARQNRSPDRNKYDSYYTPALVRRVEVRYRHDLEMLGYGFDRARSHTLPRFTAPPLRKAALVARLPPRLAVGIGTRRGLSKKRVPSP